MAKRGAGIRRRRGLARLLGLICVGSLVLVACVPDPPPPEPEPIPESTTTTTAPPPPVSVCASLGAAQPSEVASAAKPVEYVALTDGPEGPRVRTFNATSEADKQAEINRMVARDETIVAVEPDSEVHSLAIDDPVYLGPPASSSGPQWWVDRVGFEAAWGSGLAQGSGVRVAVVDSGVQADHVDLGRKEAGGNVAAGVDELPASVAGDERTDSGTHGTHVAGIVGAMDNSIGGIGGAPYVTIVPVRALNNGSGSISDVVAGILWAANPAQGDADVINLSVGGVCSDSIYEALVYAVGQGVTVVAAAGNCGCSNERLYPAAFSTKLVGVIAVAATTSSDTRASFSNFNSYVTIAAPGNQITSTLPEGNAGYGIKSGTSMASPVVAATAALVKAKCPAYTPAQVQNRLTSTAQDLGPAGWDTSFGAGIVRADLAVAPAC